MIAIREAYQHGLLKPKYFLRNLIAGLVVGIIALPLAIAFAIASGAKPEQGIYTAIVAGIVVSIFGGSRVQIAGPTGAFIVVLASITAQHGIIGLQISTLMAGGILILFGIMRLGSIIRFIPLPVIVGFTAGIAVVIWVGQWHYFLGLNPPDGDHFHEKIWSLIQNFPNFDISTTLLALSSLTILIIAPKLRLLKNVPASLLVLVFATLIATLLQKIFNISTIATIGSVFGGLPQQLPEFSIPTIRFNQLINLVGPAFAIAILGAIESLLSATVADSMSKTRHNPNQELIGQGLANVLTPLFGGFAATGAIARTAANIRNGGNSPLAGIIHALLLILILVLLAPLASYIPLCALAAILFVVAWNMSEVHRVLSIIRQAPKADVVILLTTFFMTIFTDLIVAVNIGVFMAILQFLRRMANNVLIQKQFIPLTNHNNQSPIIEKNSDKSIQLITIDGPLFFASVDQFEHVVLNQLDHARKISFDFTHVPFIDITALESLKKVLQYLASETQNKDGLNVEICFIAVNTRLDKKFYRSGIYTITPNLVKVAS